MTLGAAFLNDAGGRAASIAGRFRDKLEAKAIALTAQPVTQLCRACRHTAGSQQPFHQTVNLISGQHHVPQQQADQPSHGISNRRRGMRHRNSDAHRGSQQAEQLIESQGLRPGDVLVKRSLAEPASTASAAQAIRVGELNWIVPLSGDRK